MYSSANSAFIAKPAYTVDGILESLADSRRRLGETLNISHVRLHDAESEETFALAIKHQLIDKLVELRDAGVIGGVSLGMNSAEFLMRFLRAYPEPGTFDSIMMAGCYNLFDQRGECVLRECERRGIALHLAGVFGGGFVFGGKYLRYELASREQVAQRERWRVYCEAAGVSLGAAALAFALRRRAVTHVALGMRSAREVSVNVALMREASAIDEAFWRASPLARDKEDKTQK